MADGDCGGCEGNIAAGIAKSANRDEQLSGKLGYNMAMMRCCQEAWEVQIGFLSGV